MLLLYGELEIYLEKFYFIRLFFLEIIGIKILMDVRFIGMVEGENNFFLKFVICFIFNKGIIVFLIIIELFFIIV